MVLASFLKQVQESVGGAVTITINMGAAGTIEMSSGYSNPRNNIPAPADPLDQYVIQFTIKCRQNQWQRPVGNDYTISMDEPTKEGAFYYYQGELLLDALLTNVMLNFRDNANPIKVLEQSARHTRRILQIAREVFATNNYPGILAYNETQRMLVKLTLQNGTIGSSFKIIHPSKQQMANREPENNRKLVNIYGTDEYLLREVTPYPINIGINRNNEVSIGPTCHILRPGSPRRFSIYSMLFSSESRAFENLQTGNVLYFDGECYHLSLSPFSKGISLMFTAPENYNINAWLLRGNNECVDHDSAEGQQEERVTLFPPGEGEYTLAYRMTCGPTEYHDCVLLQVHERTENPTLAHYLFLDIGAMYLAACYSPATDGYGSCRQILPIGGDTVRDNTLRNDLKRKRRNNIVLGEEARCIPCEWDYEGSVAQQLVPLESPKSLLSRGRIAAQNIESFKTYLWHIMKRIEPLAQGPQNNPRRDLTPNQRYWENLHVVVAVPNSIDQKDLYQKNIAEVLCRYGINDVAFQSESDAVFFGTFGVHRAGLENRIVVIVDFGHSTTDISYIYVKSANNQTTDYILERATVKTGERANNNHWPNDDEQRNHGITKIGGKLVDYLWSRQQAEQDAQGNYEIGSKDNKTAWARIDINTPIPVAAAYLTPYDATYKEVLSIILEEICRKLERIKQMISIGMNGDANNDNGAILLFSGMTFNSAAVRLFAILKQLLTGNNSFSNIDNTTDIGDVFLGKELLVKGLKSGRQLSSYYLYEVSYPMGGNDTHVGYLDTINQRLLGCAINLNQYRNEVLRIITEERKVHHTVQPNQLNPDTLGPAMVQTLRDEGILP